jgi:signal transduction histidine kinase
VPAVSHHPHSETHHAQYAGMGGLGDGTTTMAHDIIVKQHGGKIDVETKLEEFTEVIITLSRDNRTSTRKESIVVP